MSKSTIEEKNQARKAERQAIRRLVVVAKLWRDVQENAGDNFDERCEIDNNLIEAVDELRRLSAVVKGLL